MVRVGDVVLHYASREIKAVSRVLHRAVEAPRPSSLPEGPWKSQGRLLRVTITELPRPIDRDEIPLSMRANQAQSMFTSGGHVNQGAVLRTLPGTAVLLEPPTVLLTSYSDGTTPAKKQRSAPPGSLDIEVKRFARTEQAALRSNLVANRRAAPCDLCGQGMSIDFLVAAHIKQRSLCSDDEQRDLRNIGMLACKFGCDDLYELGYISVDANGMITVVPPDIIECGQLVSERIAAMDGLPCLAFTEANAKYFQWHRQIKFRGARPIASANPGYAGFEHSSPT